MAGSRVLLTVSNLPSPRHWDMEWCKYHEIYLLMNTSLKTVIYVHFLPTVMTYVYHILLTQFLQVLKMSAMPERLKLWILSGNAYFTPIIYIHNKLEKGICNIYTTSWCPFVIAPCYPLSLLVWFMASNFAMVFNHNKHLGKGTIEKSSILYYQGLTPPSSPPW